MASVLDVATFILRSRGPMTAAKLEKLVYYAQAWNLAWLGKPLFDEPFEAWKYGPVCRLLFHAHRGYRTVRTHKPVEYRERLTDEQCAVIYAVLLKYGSATGDELIEQTHREDPWLTARGTLKPDEICSTVIPNEHIRAYFIRLASERPGDTPVRPDDAAVRQAKFTRAKENVLRTHAALFEQLAK
ncbi:MAG TPA: type II toxin-antitoxin system antitoxin SocA domain-containing protein [Polyangiaceae bacterium]|nr:type II toxin-antitoxin system antitoxin SocA domain-containing protein [Polyangiaceae bacterium]